MRFTNILLWVQENKISEKFYKKLGFEVLVSTDAYSEILKAEKESKIVITRYEEMSDKERAWLQRVIPKEYENGQADYRYFLMAKFPNIIKKYT